MSDNDLNGADAFLSLLEDEGARHLFGGDEDLARIPRGVERRLGAREVVGQYEHRDVGLGREVDAVPRAAVELVQPCEDPARRGGDVGARGARTGVDEQESGPHANAASSPHRAVSPVTTNERPACSKR